MILKGASDTSAEIPFTLVDGSFNPITGHSWVNFGDGTTAELYVRVPGGTMQRATISRIVSCGRGRYVYRLTAGETATAGCAMVNTNVATAQEWSTETRIADPNGTAFEIPFILYNANTLADIERVSGDWNNTGSGTTDELYIRLPSIGSFSEAVIAQITHVGRGHYVYALTPAEYNANVGGAAIIDTNVPLAAIWTHEEAIFTPLATVVFSTTNPPAEPVESPLPTYDPEYIDHTTAALNRLCEYAKVKSA